MIFQPRISQAFYVFVFCTCICIFHFQLIIHVSSIVAIVMICDISTMCYFSREFLKHFMYLYLYFSFPISVATKLETNFNPFTAFSDVGKLAKLPFLLQTLSSKMLFLAEICLYLSESIPWIIRASFRYWHRWKSYRRKISRRTGNLWWWPS